MLPKLLKGPTIFRISSNIVYMRGKYVLHQKDLKFTEKKSKNLPRKLGPFYWIRLILQVSRQIDLDSHHVQHPDGQGLKTKSPELRFLKKRLGFQYFLPFRGFQDQFLLLHLAYQNPEALSMNSGLPSSSPHFRPQVELRQLSSVALRNKRHTAGLREEPPRAWLLLARGHQLATSD